MTSPKREYSQFLIIDDDPGIAKFLVTYLRQRGHTCHALTDGFQTASWLSEHDCEVAIVDLKMPKVDGISLISFMREMNPGLPIVVFTGVGYDEEQMHAALHAGANGYVSEMHNAPQALTVSISSKSEVATVTSHRPAYLQASRSTIVSADWPRRA